MPINQQISNKVKISLSNNELLSFYDIIIIQKIKNPSNLGEKAANEFIDKISKKIYNKAKIFKQSHKLSFNFMESFFLFHILDRINFKPGTYEFILKIKIKNEIYKQTI
jgi:hypothetical protein